MPEGFTRLRLPASGFMEANGPFYACRDGGRFVLGFRVEERHANSAGMCHGGMIATLCDMLLTIGTNVQGEHSRFLPTVSMTCEFLAPARLGSWLEGRVEVLRTTRNLVFSSALLQVAGEGAVAHASGVLRLAGDPDPRFHPDRYFD